MLILLCEAAVNPEPVTVTVAVEVAVDVPGVYVTGIVQLWPGLSTVPLAHAPAAAAPIVKVPPTKAFDVLVMVGAAVNVNGPAFALAGLTVLVTVMVPFLMVVLAGPVVNAGAGAEMASVAPITLNVTVLLTYPLGSLTVAVWFPSGTSPSVKVVVAVASFTTVGGW